MSIVTRYLLTRALAPTGVALLLLCGLVFMLQVMRLGHHVVGGGLGAGFVAWLALYSLPTLLIFALPLSLAAGLVFAMGRLADTGQLLALRLAGASPPRLAAAVAALSVGAATAALVLAAHLEPAALTRLSLLLRQGAAHVLIHGPRPGRFLPLVEGTTLYVEGRLPDKGGAARFSGFFLSREAGRVVVLARRASMTLAQNQAVVIHLRNGELQHRKARGLRRVHFNSLRFSLDLAPALRRHLGFLTRLAASQDRLITAPLSCLTLGMLLAGLCLGGRAPARTSGLRLAARGLLAVALYQAAFWGVSAAWPGPAGVVLVSALVLAGGALWLWR